MSTDTLSWAAQRAIDSPWRRLPWTLPLALLICACVFMWFAYALGHSSQRAPEPPPVDAQLIEMPEPAAIPAQTHQKSAEQPREKLPVQAPQPATPPAVQATPTAAPRETTIEKPAPQTAPAVAPVQSHDAQSLSRPYPDIPDELREEALREAATARFHIAADGTATVELIKPTGNPRLNRLLLETLRRWKFAPAMAAGKPVPSTQDIVIHVQVK